ncbi:MAG TPA: ribosomal protein S5-alanine N-acetyltransferase [Herpetosiphonaceae bacterium]
MPRELPALTTRRMVLRLATSADIPAILAYFTANQQRLAPFSPIRPASFFTEAFWQEQIAQNHDDFHNDRSLRLCIFDRAAPQTMIGDANFNGFMRGVGQFCYLGYSIAAAYQGRGYMTEALETAIRYVFDELHMHRIMANYLPHNQRSGRLLRKLGFVVEGYARDYLLIDGSWQDHILTSLTNPNWTPG